MKHGLGLFLGQNLLRVVTTWRWAVPNGLTKHYLTWWSTIYSQIRRENSLRVVTITSAKYNQLVYFGSDLTRWSAYLQASFSSQDLQENKARVLLKTEDSRQRVEELRAPIPDVGVWGRQYGNLNNILCWRSMSVPVKARSKNKMRERKRDTNKFNCIIQTSWTRGDDECGHINTTRPLPWWSREATKCHRHDNSHVKIRTLDLLYYSQVLCSNQHIQIHGPVMYILVYY